MSTIIFFTSGQCSSFVIATVPIGSHNSLTWIFYIAFIFSPIYLRLPGHAPPHPHGKVGIRFSKIFWLLAFEHLTQEILDKVQDLHVDLHLLAVNLICEGQCTNWFTLQFYKDVFFCIHVMANLPNIVRQCEQLSSSPPGSSGHL